MNWYRHLFTERRLFTFGGPVCDTCLSLFKFFANRHKTRINQLNCFRGYFTSEILK